MLLKKSRLFSIVVCMITVLSVLSLMIPRNVSAEGKDKSLTLVCVSGDTVLVGMEWRLHKVGQRVNNSRNFIQTGDFAGIQINMRRLTPETVQQAAQTFQSYAISSGIAPIQTAVTNEAGEAKFTGLDAGLYLISGKVLKNESYYYQPTTALVELRDEDSDLKYNAYPKFEYQVMNAHPVAHVVYKEWLLDELHMDLRPDHVTVDIYKDEEYYQTVTLSDDNNWRYRWVDAEGLSSWLVMEKEVPEHYEVNIEYNTNYRIQNSYTEETYFATTSPSGSQTATTTTTTISTAISAGQDSKTEGTTTATTTAPYQHADFSRTRTTTTITNGSASNVRTTTATTNTVQNGSATRTKTTTNNQQNASVTTTLASGETTTGVSGSGSNTTTEGSGSSTTTTRNSGGSGSGGGSGNGSGGGGSSGGKTNYSSGSSSIKLPQTGQLWWPVVPLSIGGVLFVSAGLVIKTRKKSDD